MRACPSCGTPEQRGVHEGRSWVNLDPKTDLCLGCLVRQAKAQAKPMPALPRDWQRAASGDVE